MTKPLSPATRALGRARRPLGGLLALATLSATACANPEAERSPLQALWPQAPEQVAVQEPIDFHERTEDDPGYLLPREDQLGMADLIALFPATGVRRDEPNLFVSSEIELSTDQCQGGGPTTLADLPIELEAVVTLHPRHYLKPTICEQEERNYGAYVLSDDTGGVVVLRDGRTTPFTFGDRVRLTVHGIMQSFGDPASRFVVLADVEPLPAPLDAQGHPIRPVYYTLHTVSEGPFENEHVGEVRRIEGYVAVAPTNDNFNDMILTSAALPEFEGDRSTADPVCLELCGPPCRRSCPSSDDVVCRTAICPAFCQGEGARVQASDLPTCWAASIDPEIGRRGFSPEPGTRLAVTGPVARGFQRNEIWVIRLGQIELLDSPEER